eukprot:5576984-Prymnesium_polylepis.1
MRGAHARVTSSSCAFQNRARATSAATISSRQASLASPCSMPDARGASASPRNIAMRRCTINSGLGSSDATALDDPSCTTAAWPHVSSPAAVATAISVHNLVRWLKDSGACASLVLMRLGLLTLMLPTPASVELIADGAEVKTALTKAGSGTRKMVAGSATRIDFSARACWLEEPDCAPPEPFPTLTGRDAFRLNVEIHFFPYGILNPHVAVSRAPRAVSRARLG